jgi:thioredoxin-like negative regulator of GroEL
VHVRARTADGRQDEDMGVVNIDGLAGDAAANAILKAITKAKRRVTLSICGLGWLDETEADAIPGAQPLKAEPDGLFADQDGYIAHFEETMADIQDGPELKRAWDEHQANSQARLDAAHAVKALQIYEAAQKRIAGKGAE